MAKTNPFNIALYIRVSTEEQAENPEGSIRNQEERLRQAVEYKNRNGDFGEIKAVYIDPGISAKDMKRPKLQELLRAIRSKEIDLVMVTELSRLSRSMRDFIQIWDMMQVYGCKFSSLREDFDTTTATGEMVIFQLMNLAQFERRQTSERVEANIAVRAGRGLYNGGSVPVGYRTIPDKPGFLEVDPEMADMVRTAFVTFLKEGCLSHAAKWLNDNGYVLRKQREGGGRLKRTGHFTVDNLQSVLRNKTYLGIKSYRVKKELRETKAVWPAIIDELTFQRAGKLLEKNRRRFKPEKQGKLPYLFSGVTFCSTCKSPMSGKSAHGNSGKVGYYEHAWASKRDSTLTKKIFKCDPHRIPAKILEPAVWEKLTTYVTDAHFMKRVFEKVKEKHELNPHRKDMERLKAKLAGLNSQIDALSERLAELPKSVSATPIYKQMERLQGIKEEQEQAFTELKLGGRTNFERIVGLETFEDFAHHYRKLVFKDLSVAEKKQMIQKFIHKVEVGVKTYKLHFIVDKDHYDGELALQAGSRRGPRGGEDFFKHFGSNTLTFGAPART